MFSIYPTPSWWLRVRSWNNGMRCMSHYILMPLIEALSPQHPLECPHWARRLCRDTLQALGRLVPQIARFMGPTWGPPGSCRPQMSPMLAHWTLLSGSFPSRFPCNNFHKTSHYKFVIRLEDKHCSWFKKNHKLWSQHVISAYHRGCHFCMYMYWFQSDVTPTQNSHWDRRNQSL